MAGHVVPMEVLRGIFVDVRIKEGDAALLSSPLLGLPVVRLRLTWMLMEIEGRRMTQGTQTAQSLNAYRVLRLRPSRWSPVLSQGSWLRTRTRTSRLSVSASKTPSRSPWSRTDVPTSTCNRPNPSDRLQTNPRDPSEIQLKIKMQSNSPRRSSFLTNSFSLWVSMLIASMHLFRHQFRKSSQSKETDPVLVSSHEK